MSNIYQKLDVHSRTQALERARSLKVLSWYTKGTKKNTKSTKEYSEVISLDTSGDSPSAIAFVPSVFFFVPFVY
jgi:hypothetical protein